MKIVFNKFLPKGNYYPDARNEGAAYHRGNDLDAESPCTCCSMPSASMSR